MLKTCFLLAATGLLAVTSTSWAVSPTPDPLLAPSADLEMIYGQAGGLSWWRGSLQRALIGKAKIGDQFTLRYGPHYGFVSLHDSDEDVPGEETDLHEVALMAFGTYEFRNSPWTIFSIVQPGLYSSLSEVDHNDFTFIGRAGAFYQWSDTLTFNFGISHTRSLGEPQLLPFAGFAWEVNDQFGLRLIGDRLTASYKVNEDLYLRAGGFAVGGEWNLEDDAEGSVDLEFFSYHVGVGFDQKISEKLWFTLWAGVALGNEVEVEDTGGNDIYSENYDTGWFVSAGIKAYEW